MNTVVQDLIQSYRPGYALAQAFYTDPKIFDAEQRAIFHKHWIYALHQSEISEPGDFKLLEFEKESVIIARTASGEIKAHLNVCRHRGSRVCLEPSGRKKLFTCPYHAWAYDLDGALVAARHMPDEFDRASHGLISVKLANIGGLIFISLAEKPPSIAPVQHDLADIIDLFGLSDLKVAEHKRYHIPANWKLAVENYQECYHCAPSHQDYARVHALAQSPEEFTAQKQEYLARASAPYQTLNISHYFDQANDGEESFQYARYPLLPGRQSGGKDGGPVAPLLGNLTEYDGASSEFSVGPLSFFLIYSDHMVGYRFLPKAIDECMCDIFWYVRGDAREGTDYNLDKLTWLWDVTTQADKTIITNNQKGVNSAYYVPGPLSKMESFEQHFINWYLKSLSAPA